MNKEEIEEIEKAYWIMVIDHCTNREIWNFVETTIKEAKNKAENDLINKIEVLIADEMLIAQKEGQPTSRLTSLAVKLKEIK